MNSANFVGTPEKTFRDAISTVDKAGKRVWLYPKNPKGRYTRYRTLVAWVLVLLMVSGPFMQPGGEPLLLFNVIERKFILFGKIFWPQDFHIFLLIMIAMMLFVVLFTVIYGRIFCGWICPQTIFMESVFRKIEYWIEGDWKTRMALDRAPLSPAKFFKKSLKHSVFFLISFFIAAIFLSYIIGLETVIQMLSAPAEQPGAMVALLLFTAVFYWVFARFREQVCTTVCPYGRLQGVLTDKNSLVVAYDYVRGENRGKLKAREDRSQAGKGDCIDCNQCVHVCPMGIDIRNGTQLECTNCTACMDACDFMMRKVGLAEGLIRMDSEAGIAEGKPFRFTARILAYSSVLVVLLVFVGTLLAFRSDVETSMLRTPGIMYQEMPDGRIGNLYNIKMINKTNREINVDLRSLSEEAELQLVGKSLLIPAQGTAETAAFIVLDRAAITKTKTTIRLGVYADQKELETLTTTFVGPVTN